MALSIAGFFVFVLVYCQLQNASPEFYGVAVAVYSRGVFWLVLCLSIGICVLLNFSAEWLRREFFPSNIDVTMELERGLGGSRATSTGVTSSAHHSPSHQVKSNPSFRLEGGSGGVGATPAQARRVSPPHAHSSGAVTHHSPLENVHSVRGATAHRTQSTGNPKLASLEL